MPRGSKVICVDLVPIKPIKGVVTIQSDITTQTCRNLIKQELSGKSHVCDLVLNDGAPNVGSAWSKDAYNQAELTLYAFQLACDLLKPGGTFVTKVFRSSDYNSLLWAFQQLFNKVESTKPSASRAVSAEIFVVCQGFKAPSKVDPKFFNPKFVFMNEEVDNDEDDEGEESAAKRPVAAADKPSSLSGLLKAVGKRNRSGYAPGDEFRTVTVDEFLASRNPAELLIKCHKILIPEAREDSVKIPESIASYFEDIKVLGKGELYGIMKWRTKALNELRKGSKTAAEGETDEADNEDGSSSSEDEAAVQKEKEDKQDGELERLLKSRMAEEKRELKRQRVKEKKSLMRKKMSLDGVVGIAETTSASFEPDLFHLPNIRDKSKIVVDAMEDAPHVTDEMSETEVDQDLKIPQYQIVERGSKDLLQRYEDDFAQDYQERKDAGRTNQAGTSAAADSGSRGKKVTRRMKHMADWAAEVDALGDSIDKKAYALKAAKRADDAASSDDSDCDAPVPVLNEDVDSEFEFQASGPVTTVAAPKKTSSVMASRWFSNPIFAAGGADSDDEDNEETANDASAISGELDEKDLPVIPLSEKQEKRRKRKEKKMATGGDDEDGCDIEVVAAQQPPTLDEVAEIQAMGSLMVHKKSRMEVIESGFNRYARDDPVDLPEWFTEEEEKFTRKQLPLTKELMTQYRAKLREINARPIRKEAEAQGRRKRRMDRKMSTLKKQANSLVGNDDGDDPSSGHGSIHKAKQIVRGMKAVKKEGQRKTVFLAVQKKGGPSKQISGEGGRGAKVAMIDRRLKKDRRGERNAKARKGGKGGRR